MLAGLIFATDDADDRPGMLAGTLPFGGLTLVEFQARLAVAAGASQIVLVVARMTPELLGAISRIGRRGVSVDAVRTAAEVVEKLHPLARVLVIADGVATTGDIVSSMATTPGDTLLVTDSADDRYERIGGLTHWAGLALLDGKRIADVAALPCDYDFQSTLLRVAAQGGADQVRLDDTARTIHTIERGSRALAVRGNAILTALVVRPIRWADRFLVASLVRLALPPLMARVVPTFAVVALAGVVGLAGLVAIYAGWPVLGLVLACLTVVAVAIAAALAWVRDEDRAAKILNDAPATVAALSALLLGVVSAAPVGWVLASAAIAAGALLERAAEARHQRRWWASPAAYPILMLMFVIAGEPLVALAATALYAAATLAAAIEAFREKP